MKKVNINMCPILDGYGVRAFVYILGNIFYHDTQIPEIFHLLQKTLRDASRVGSSVNVLRLYVVLLSGW
jgi:hypothetical protein